MTREREHGGDGKCFGELKFCRNFVGDALQIDLKFPESDAIGEFARRLPVLPARIGPIENGGGVLAIFVLNRSGGGGEAVAPKALEGLPVVGVFLIGVGNLFLMTLGGGIQLALAALVELEEGTRLRAFSGRFGATSLGFESRQLGFVFGR